MHQYFLFLLAGSVVLYHVLDRVILIRPSRFLVYYTAVFLLSAGLIYLLVHRVA
jgi:hypothetical protein